MLLKRVEASGSEDLESATVAKVVWDKFLCTLLRPPPDSGRMLSATCSCRCCCMSPALQLWRPRSPDLPKAVIMMHLPCGCMRNLHLTFECREQLSCLWASLYDISPILTHSLQIELSSSRHAHPRSRRAATAVARAAYASRRCFKQGQLRTQSSRVLYL